MRCSSQEKSGILFKLSFSCDDVGNELAQLYEVHGVRLARESKERPDAPANHAISCTRKKMHQLSLDTRETPTQVRNHTTTIENKKNKTTIGKRSDVRGLDRDRDTSVAFSGRLSRRVRPCPAIGSSTSRPKNTLGRAPIYSGLEHHRWLISIFYCAGVLVWWSCRVENGITLAMMSSVEKMFHRGFVCALYLFTLVDCADSCR